MASGSRVSAGFIVAVTAPSDSGPPFSYVARGVAATKTGDVVFVVGVVVVVALLALWRFVVVLRRERLSSTPLPAGEGRSDARSTEGAGR